MRSCRPFRYSIVQKNAKRLSIILSVVQINNEYITSSLNILPMGDCSAVFSVSNRWYGMANRVSPFAISLVATVPLKEEYNKDNDQKLEQIIKRIEEIKPSISKAL